MNLIFIYFSKSGGGSYLRGALVRRNMEITNINLIYRSFLINFVLIMYGITNVSLNIFLRVKNRNGR